MILSLVISVASKESPVMDPELEQGVSGLWTTVNHVALVVSNVGRSLTFYTDVIGMKQVLRPNFDR